MRGDRAAPRGAGRRSRSVAAGFGAAVLLVACAAPDMPGGSREPAVAQTVSGAAGSAAAGSGAAGARATGSGATGSGPGAVGSGAVGSRFVVPAADAQQIERTYPGARTYSGVLSCAGCERSRFTVTIFANGTFRLRDEPLDTSTGGASDMRSVVTDHGRWHTQPNAANRIVLAGKDGERLLQRVAPDGLTILDHEGRPLRGLADATLSREATVDPLSGPMRLVGHYGFEGSQRVFVECAGGRRLPVLAEVSRGSAINPAQATLNPAQAALDSAWQGLQPQPGEPVLAVLQAYLVPRAGQRAGPHEEALVVADFERLTRNGACPSGAPDAR